MSRRRRYLRRASWLLVILVGVLLWWLFRDRLAVEEWVEHEQRLREWTERNRLTALFLALCLMAATSLVPGTPGKTFVYGWLFGFWVGLLLVNVGMTLGAAVAFLLCRYFFRDLVKKHWSYVMRRVNRALEHGGATYLLMTRLLFAPFTATNYVLAATGVRLRTFCWTTQLGILPGNIVFVYAGSQLPSLQQISEQGASSLWSFELLVALILLSVAPLLVRLVARRIWPRAAPEAG